MNMKCAGLEHTRTTWSERHAKNKKFVKKTHERHETHETRIIVLSILLSFFTLRKGMKKIKNFSETHESHETHETPVEGQGLTLTPSLNVFAQRQSKEMRNKISDSKEVY
jgi:hypothetical protein